MMIERKTDKIIQATISDENGPIDITNVSITWNFWNDDVIAISKSGTEITKIDAVNGKIEFELDNADTDIESGKYEYEVLITDVEANRYLPSKGVLTINNNKSSKGVI